MVAWVRKGPAMIMNSSASQVSEELSDQPDWASTASPSSSGAIRATGVT
jgi:hypothetical protein